MDGPDKQPASSKRIRLSEKLTRHLIFFLFLSAADIFTDNEQRRARPIVKLLPKIEEDIRIKSFLGFKNKAANFRKVFS